ncbi:MAG: hypothetical protein ACRDFW_09655 [bacterium]
MSEFRAALRGVAWYLLFGWVAVLVSFIIADLVGAAAGVLMFVIPGLAAGLAAGGGWKRGLFSGVLGAVTIIAALLAFGGPLRIGQAFGEFFRFFLPLALASAASGAAGGEIRARRGRR